MQDAMKRLRQLREELHHTQGHVAFVTGVEPKQVSQWETGKNQPSASSLAVYIRLVQASADEIIDLIMKDQPDPEKHLATILQAQGGKARLKRVARRLLEDT